MTEKLEDRAEFLQVDAEPRYWEDAYINEKQCDNDTGLNEDEDVIPARDGKAWKPVISIRTGEFLDWPIGKTGDFHFKICDQGCYYLLDEDRNRIAKSKGYYVPSGLCHGDDGYGDYIIFRVDEDGKIKEYKNRIEYDRWELLA